MDGRAIGAWWLGTLWFRAGRLDSRRSATTRLEPDGQRPRVAPAVSWRGLRFATPGTDGPSRCDGPTTGAAAGRQSSASPRALWDDVCHRDTGPAPIRRPRPRARTRGP